jgi:hypothetical protein
VAGTRRTNMVLTDRDEANIVVIQDAHRITSKIGAVRYALGVACMIASGDARLVDKQGKPIRTIATG